MVRPRVQDTPSPAWWIAAEIAEGWRVRPGWSWDRCAAELANLDLDPAVRARCRVSRPTLQHWVALRRAHLEAGIVPASVRQLSGENLRKLANCWTPAPGVRSDGAER